MTYHRTKRVSGPIIWRFWRDLPPKGQIGLFQSCRYSRPILDHVHGRIDTADFDEKLKRILAFEKMLADDGALILKFWMHLGQDAQKRRLRSLEKDPLQSWRVKKSDWRNWKRYDQFIATAERTLRRTGTGQTRWVIVEGEDARFRSLTVLTTLGEAIRKHLIDRAARLRIIAESRDAMSAKRSAELAHAHDSREAMERAAEAEARPRRGRRAKQSTVKLTAEGRIKPLTVLDSMDMSQSVGKDDYALALKQARAESRQSAPVGQRAPDFHLARFRRRRRGRQRRRHPASDRRPRCSRLSRHPHCRAERRGTGPALSLAVLAPSATGRAGLPYSTAAGTAGSWSNASRASPFPTNGCGLTPRSMISKSSSSSKAPSWRNFGSISARTSNTAASRNAKSIAYKKWKLTDEDWRNRAKWDDYETAVNEMVERTSTSEAPWVLVEGNDKNFSRIKIIRTVCERLQQRLG